MMASIYLFNNSKIVDERISISVTEHIEMGGTDRGANHTRLPKFRCGGAQHDAPLAAPWVGSVAQSAALTSGWFVVNHVSGGRF